MGGGNTRRQEVAKRLRRRGADKGDDGNAGSGASGEAARETPICEREQAVAFRVLAPLATGATVRVGRGDPPVLIAGSTIVGSISNWRQAATLAACIDDGYLIGGTVVAIDDQLDEGLVTLIGVRSG